MGRFNFGKAMKAAVKDGTLEKAVDKMEADLAAEEEEATTTATAELPPSDQNLVVRCPPRSASSSPTIRGSAQITPMPLLRLSAFDRLVAGRTVPMIWYYRTTLNTSRLVRALEATLGAYPVLCGRYAAAVEGRPPYDAVALTNEGIPLEVRHSASTLPAATAHLRAEEAEGGCDSSSSSSASASAPRFFARSTHATVCPTRVAMDPDAYATAPPLVSLRITHFAGGGTAIALLAQHAIMDAEADMDFMSSWAQMYRAAEGASLAAACASLAPDHSRGDAFASITTTGQDLPAKEEGGEDAVLPALDFESGSDAQLGAPPPGLEGTRVIAHGEQHIPAFAHLLPRIAGDAACVVPFTAAQLDAIKASAVAELAADGTSRTTSSEAGEWISTDDALTALVWRALFAMRSEQLDLNTATMATTTTLMRAVNLRRRIAPPLSSGFCGNAVMNLATRCAASTFGGGAADGAGAAGAGAPSRLCLGAVAAKLRRDLTAGSSDSVIRAHAAWVDRAHNVANARVKFAHDADGLTFVVSSWRCDWERVVFANSSAVDADEDHGVPLCFDHGALAPIVANFTSRKGGDGVDVWTCGTESAVIHFARTLEAAKTDLLLLSSPRVAAAEKEKKKKEEEEVEDTGAEAGTTGRAAKVEEGTTEAASVGVPTVSK